MIPLDQLRVLSSRHPNKPAVSCNGEDISFAVLFATADAKVRFLAHWNGEEKPENAVFISPNRIELIGWLAAFATLKIPVTGIDFSLPEETILELIDALKADVVLVSSLRVPGIDRLIEAQRAHLIDLDSPTVEAVWTNGDDTRDIDTIIARANREPRPTHLVGITSGTSGRPKLTLRTRSFDVRRFDYFTRSHGFNASDRFLVAIPLYHAAGNGWTRLFLGLGATIEIVDALGPTNLAERILEQAITVTVLTPPLVDRLLAEADDRAEACAFNLRWVLVGGKNFAPVTKTRALDRLGPVVHEYYGTTETGVNVIATPTDLRAFPDSVGRAFDGNHLVILDSSRKPLPVGEIGRVAIASYMNMDRYLNAEADTVELDGERYLVTADTGRLDADGRLFLVNRALAGNMGTTPFYKLENDLRALPCISDATVIPRRDDDRTIHVAVAVRNDRMPPSPRLVDRIRALIASERLEIGQLTLLDRIPYSPSGKVRVADLATNAVIIG
jgi:long-chain acyl-CoA synthetase